MVFSGWMDQLSVEVIYWLWGQSRLWESGLQTLVVFMLPI